MLPHWSPLQYEKDTLGPLEQNRKCWLEACKTPTKLFVMVNLPRLATLTVFAPYAERNPDCTVAQTRNFWVGRFCRNNNDWIHIANSLITSSTPCIAGHQPWLDLNKYTWQLLAPAPSKMSIVPPLNSHICIATFGIRYNAWQCKKGSAGIKFRISVTRTKSNSKEIKLWDRTLRPATIYSDRFPQSIKLNLTTFSPSKVIFETIPDGSDTINYLPYWSHIQLR
jgi:hypothetical protein